MTKPSFPRIIPHSDGAGVIEAVGRDVNARHVGQRVWIWNGQWQRPFGKAAEYIALPAVQAVPLPDTVSFEIGATLGIPGLTATHTIFGGGDVAGQTLLISGGAGAVGHKAVQLPFGPCLFKALKLDITLVYILPDAARQAAITRLHAALESEALRPAIHGHYSLADYARAHEAVMTPGRKGAVLLNIG